MSTVKDIETKYDDTSGTVGKFYANELNLIKDTLAYPLEKIDNYDSKNEKALFYALKEIAVTDKLSVDSDDENNIILKSSSGDLLLDKLNNLNHKEFKFRPNKANTDKVTLTLGGITAPLKLLGNEIEPGYLKPWHEYTFTYNGTDNYFVLYAKKADDSFAIAGKKIDEIVLKTDSDSMYLKNISGRTIRAINDDLEATLVNNELSLNTTDDDVEYRFYTGVYGNTIKCSLKDITNGNYKGGFIISNNIMSLLNGNKFSIAKGDNGMLLSDNIINFYTKDDDDNTFSVESNLWDKKPYYEMKIKNVDSGDKILSMGLDGINNRLILGTDTALKLSVNTAKDFITNSSFIMRKVTDQGGTLLRADSSVYIHSGELVTISAVLDKIAEERTDSGEVKDIQVEETTITSDRSICFYTDIQEYETKDDVISEDKYVFSKTSTTLPSNIIKMHQGSRDVITVNDTATSIKYDDNSKLVLSDDYARIYSNKTKFGTGDNVLFIYKNQISLYNNYLNDDNRSRGLINYINDETVLSFTTLDKDDNIINKFAMREDYLNVDNLKSYGGGLQVYAGEARNYITLDKGEESLNVAAENGIRIYTPDSAHSNFEDGWKKTSALIKGDYLRLKNSDDIFSSLTPEALNLSYGSDNSVLLFKNELNLYAKNDDDDNVRFLFNTYDNGHAGEISFKINNNEKTRVLFNDEEVSTFVNETKIVNVKEDHVDFFKEINIKEPVSDSNPITLSYFNNNQNFLLGNTKKKLYIDLSDGDDDNYGTDETNPLKTLVKALDLIAEREYIDVDIYITTSDDDIDTYYLTKDITLDIVNSLSIICIDDLTFEIKSRNIDDYSVPYRIYYSNLQKITLEKVNFSFSKDDDNDDFDRNYSFLEFKYTYIYKGKTCDSDTVKAQKISFHIKTCNIDISHGVFWSFISSEELTCAFMTMIDSDIKLYYIWSKRSIVYIFEDFETTYISNEYGYKGFKAFAFRTNYLRDNFGLSINLLSKRFLLDEENNNVANPFGKDRKHAVFASGDITEDGDINVSYNVASVTHDDTGVYTIEFMKDHTRTDYKIMLSAEYRVNGVTIMYDDIAKDSFKVKTNDTNDSSDAYDNAFKFIVYEV